MNILFLTITQFPSIKTKGIYTDLMREFKNRGHNVFIVNPTERKYKQPTKLRTDEGVKILDVWTLNFQKTNFIEKGFSTLAIQHQYYNAIRKYLSNEQFDLIIYSTPPITFTKTVRFLKKKNKAKSYLLLKDIFPQNAIDIGLLKEGGLVHRFFQKKEKELYEISDYIGCMSPENVNYLLKNNPYINSEKVEVCPNSLELYESKNNFCDKTDKFKSQNNINPNATIFIYGGNLGKPQGIGFLLQVLESNKEKKDRFFLIVGSGTEYSTIENWFNKHKPENASLIPGMAKDEYDKLVNLCGVGLIFLDPRFTIPNFPSRLLSYLECKMPVLLATDINTDIGKIAEENQFGFWSESGDLNKFNTLIDNLCYNESLARVMGENGYNFLKENYTVSKSYEIIMKHFIQ